MYAKQHKIEKNVEKVAECLYAWNLIRCLIREKQGQYQRNLNDVIKDFPVPVYVEEMDKDMMTDGNKNLSGNYVNGGFQFADVKTVKDGQILEIAGFQFRVIHTPGHTPGGCCYYVEKEGVLFSGDTLFQASVGRSDFPGGSASDLVRSVKEKLLILPDETHVYPGHMDETTIGYEKLYNPFV